MLEIELSRVSNIHFVSFVCWCYFFSCIDALEEFFRRHAAAITATVIITTKEITVRYIVNVSKAFNASAACVSSTCMHSFEVCQQLNICILLRCSWVGFAFQNQLARGTLECRV